MSQLLDLRRRPILYGRYCKTFLKCVVGDNKWRSNYLTRPLKAFVSKSDEAFVLVVLENSWHRWMKQYSSNNPKDTTFDAQYTNSGVSSRDGKTKRYCGWSEEGVTRFNTLCVQVMEDRKKYPQFDKELLATWQANSTARVRAEMDQQVVTPAVEPMTDFPWDNDGEEVMQDWEGDVEPVLDESGSFGIIRPGCSSPHSSQQPSTHTGEESSSDEDTPPQH